MKHNNPKWPIVSLGKVYKADAVNKLFLNKHLSCEWKKTNLGNICKLYQPKTISQKEMICNGKYVVFGANGIIGRYDKYNHKETEVLVTCRGATCGTVRLSEPKSWITGNAMVISPLFNGVNKIYIYYLLKDSNFDPVISGAAQPQITRQNLSLLQVILPPLKEQKAIVRVLEIWDKAIEKTEALIAVKEKQFKWLLKALITDQQSNPSWKKTTLGSLGTISSSGVDKKIVVGEKFVKLVNYLDVLNKDFLYFIDLNHWVTASKNKIIKCNVKKGDVFFTPSSEIQGDIAHSAVVMENMNKVAYSYHIVRFRLKENLDILFRAYIFKSDQFLKQAYSLCQGSGQRYVISQDDFRKMTITFPPDCLEQKKISKILNNTQNEIIYLKKLVDKYNIQKNGIMQKLLTGKWRIKI